jgi:hypothetical protein
VTIHAEANAAVDRNYVWIDVVVEHSFHPSDLAPQEAHEPGVPPVRHALQQRFEKFSLLWSAAT